MNKFKFEATFWSIRHRSVRWVLAIAVCMLAAAASPTGAEVLLDDVVQAGEFLFLRDSVKDHGYHYAPANLRLAPDAEGRPQFLFVKYTRAETETTGALQGGLLHALMTWGLDAEGLGRARSALRRVDPRGELVGPVSIRDGYISVVSAAATVEGTFVSEIVGTGRCAVLPGGRCALGMSLTPAGATLLWETMQRATSDVSVAFLVKFKGLTPGFRARMTVDWDKVYSQHDVQVGLTAEYFKLKGRTEVGLVLDSLRESGAIQVIVDGEDTEMQKLWETVYGHLTKLMFDTKVGTPKAPKPRSAGSPVSQIASAAAKVLSPKPCGKQSQPRSARTGRSEPRSADTLAAAPAVGAGDRDGPTAERTGEDTTEPAATGGPGRSPSTVPPSGRGLRRGEPRRADGAEAVPATGRSTSRSATRRRARGPASGASAGSGSATGATPDSSGSENSKPCSGGGESGGDEGADTSGFGAELKITYSYRREKRSGHYEVDFRKRTREEREILITQNLGGFIQSDEDVARYLVEVNLDDEFFEDRPVEVLLDGQDYQDFAQYINAVDVKFRRPHHDGSATEGSIVFTEDQFAAQGNRRRWTYPRLGDQPEDWLDYSYKVDWHFNGGATVPGVWQETDASVVTLSPPASYRTLRISADLEDLDGNDVLAVSVQLRSKLFGDNVQSELVIVADRGDPLATDYRYLQDPDDPSYEVKVVWATRDGREVIEDWSRREAGFVFLRFPSDPEATS